MRAIQVLTVIALGACAVLLAVGTIWFFDVTPNVTVDTAPVTVSAPDRCDRFASVGAADVIGNAFPDAHVTGGDVVCLVDGPDDVTSVHAVAAGGPGAVLFSVGAGMTDADLVKIGLTPTS